MKTPKQHSSLHIDYESPDWIDGHKTGQAEAQAEIDRLRGIADALAKVVAIHRFAITTTGTMTPRLEKIGREALAAWGEARR